MSPRVGLEGRVRAEPGEFRASARVSSRTRERFEGRLELPCTLEAPWLARRWLCEQFAAELSGSELANAKLLVSELVTNAVVHGGGGIGLSAGLDSECLRVDVSDDGKRFTPVIRAPTLGRGGLGLELVEDIASHWGIGEEATTRVWFDLDRTSPTVFRAG